MPTLLELTADIVSAHVANKQMTSDEMLQELQKVHASLKALESGSLAEQPGHLTIRQAFRKDVVICMICRQGFRSLKRHLAQTHGLKPAQYRKQFNLPSSQSLTAKSYSESRRQAAIEKGLGEELVKARAAGAKGGKVRKGVAPVKVKAETPAPAARPSGKRQEIKAPAKARGPKAGKK